MTQGQKDTKFTRFLMHRFREYEDRRGRKVSVSEWARSMGLKQATLYRWMIGEVDMPDSASIAVLVNYLGEGVYDALNIAPPKEISVQDLPPVLARRLESATVEFRKALTSSGLPADSPAAWALAAETFRSFGFEVADLSEISA